MISVHIYSEVTNIVSNFQLYSNVLLVLKVTSIRISASSYLRRGAEDVLVSP